MRIRWDEGNEDSSGSHRFLGFTALTWGIAVPVAFIAGAAVMSSFAQWYLQTEPPTPVAPVASQNTVPRLADENRIAAEKSKLENEAKVAAAKAAQLQAEVKTLRDQVSEEARLREEAEQLAAEKSNELDRIQQAEPSVVGSTTGTLAVSSADAPVQNPLSYTASEPALASAPAFRGQAEFGGQLHSPASMGEQGDAQRVTTSPDTLAVQRIIEDTASRSAALSDKRDEFEAEQAPDILAIRPEKAPREDGVVETALGRATGLENLSVVARNGLKTDLVEGECVTVSLEKVLGNPVPVVPLRNLVRDLDSDC